MNNSTEWHGLRLSKLPDRLSGTRHPGGYGRNCSGRLGLTLGHQHPEGKEILNEERTEAQRLYPQSLAKFGLGWGLDHVDFSIQRPSPSTHTGSFFGNAIADWTGVVVIVIATKYLYEKGSSESRRPPQSLLSPIRSDYVTIPSVYFC